MKPKFITTSLVWLIIATVTKRGIIKSIEYTDGYNGIGPYQYKVVGPEIDEWVNENNISFEDPEKSEEDTVTSE
jgi:hypothetical protein